MAELVNKLGLGIIIRFLTKVFRRPAASQAGPPECEGGTAQICKRSGTGRASCARAGVARAGPIGKEDQRWIAEHIHELFEAGTGHGEGYPAGTGPVTEEDKKRIMEHIHEMFPKSGGTNGGKPS